MKSFCSTVLLSLLVASFGAAKECNKSNAKQWSTAGGVEGCNGDADCIAIVLDGQCNSQVLADSGNSKCVKDTRKRATSSITCSSSETCFLYIDGDLMCLNQANGEYHDSSGGHGNYKSGIYTYADGEVLTNSGTAAGTKTGAALKTATTAALKTTGAAAERTSAAVTTTAAAIGNSIVQTQSAATASPASTTRSQGAAPTGSIANESLLSMASFALACAFWL